MPMIARGDDDRIDRRVVENTAHIGNRMISVYSSLAGGVRQASTIGMAKVATARKEKSRVRN